MRLAWSTDPWGYTLRDGNGNARATMVRDHEEFWGQVITRGLPDSGPYKSRKEAADWVTQTLARLELVPVDSEFTAIPEIPAGKRAT